MDWFPLYGRLPLHFLLHKEAHLFLTIVMIDLQKIIKNLSSTRNAIPTIEWEQKYTTQFPSVKSRKANKDEDDFDIYVAVLNKI